MRKHTLVPEEMVGLSVELIAATLTEIVELKSQCFIIRDSNSKTKEMQ